MVTAIGDTTAGGSDEGKAEGEVKEQFTGDNVRASWPFSLHTIRTNLSHCSPEGREALIGAFLWCTDNKHPVHKDEFSERVGYSPNVIYKLLSGKYLHPESKRQLDVPGDLVKAIKTFLALERERVLGGANEFVMTPTARKIHNYCDLARESQTPVLVIGASQIGKTWALEHYANDNNHGRTPYIRMKAASGLGGLIRRMAERLGISSNGNTSDLTERIKNGVTKDMVLILDEVHLLHYTYRLSSFFSCMEVIREIQDETKCGLVLCATQLLLGRMEEGKNKEMVQMLRRGVHRCMLPDMPTKGDLGAIFHHWGLEFPKQNAEVEIQEIVEKPYEVVRQLAKTQGLKAITERMRYGRKISMRYGSKLTWTHVMEAHLTIASGAKKEEDWD